MAVGLGLIPLHRLLLEAVLDDPPAGSIRSSGRKIIEYPEDFEPGS
jgi:hypothetical protein